MALASVEKSDSLYTIKRYVKIDIILAKILRLHILRKLCIIRFSNLSV